MHLPHVYTNCRCLKLFRCVLTFVFTLISKVWPVVKSKKTGTIVKNNDIDVSKASLFHIINTTFFYSVKPESNTFVVLEPCLFFLTFLFNLERLKNAV